MNGITDLLEALMIICFGLSWPISIRKSWFARTAKGKSVFFVVFIVIGYIFGIIRKFILINQAESAASLGFLFYFALAFYFINVIEITIDILLWVRNTRLDKAAERASKKAVKQ